MLVAGQTCRVSSVARVPGLAARHAKLFQRRSASVRCAAGAKPAEAPASPYEALKGCMVYRASSSELVDISTLWSEDELRRDALPVLERNGVKLLCVSIGTPERAKDFVKETGFPGELLYADPENVTYEALRFHKGWGRTFLRVETPFSIKERIEGDGAADLRDILPRWKPWLPPKTDQGLQQGGTFVFKGRKAVLEHYDESTGAHAPLDAVLRAAGCAPA